VPRSLQQLTSYRKSAHSPTIADLFFFLNQLQPPNPDRGCSGKSALDLSQFFWIILTVFNIIMNMLIK
jgi:hypothetical protein